MKKLIAILMAVMMLAGLAGCGTPQEAPKTEKPLKKVKVLLDWTPNTNHTGVYAAQKLGYYQAQGLDVEILPAGSSGPAQIVGAGQADVAFSYQEEVTIARTKGVPVKAIAAVIQHNTSGFASPVEKNIKTPQDFAGKKYGGWGSPAEEAMLKALMNQENADFKKVAMINIGEADFFTSVRKDVDFAWIFWGWTGIESELKGIKLNFVALRGYNDALDFYSPVLIANEKALKDDPDTIAKFVQATAEGYTYAIQQPEAAGQILVDSVPELNKELVMASQKYLAKEYQGDARRWGEMSAERWKKYADWMLAQGLIEQPLAADQAFTNEFLSKE